MKLSLFLLSYFIVSALTSQSTAVLENQQTEKNSVENCLRPKILIAGEGNTKSNIIAKMEYYKVPGVTIAIVNDNKIEWSQG